MFALISSTRISPPPPKKKKKKKKLKSMDYLVSENVQLK